MMTLEAYYPFPLYRCDYMQRTFGGCKYFRVVENLQWINRWISNESFRNCPSSWKFAWNFYHGFLSFIEQQKRNFLTMWQVINKTHSNRIIPTSQKQSVVQPTPAALGNILIWIRLTDCFEHLQVDRQLFLLMPTPLTRCSLLEVV